MEVFIGFVLLIGALALSSHPPTPDEAQNNEKVGVKAEQSAAAQVANTDLPCRYSDGPLMQRDLTLAHLSNGARSRLEDEASQVARSNQ
jgi:hypothetical protein